MNKPYSSGQIFWQTWRASRDGAAAIQARQTERLVEMVAFARRHSRFYASLYRDIPGPVDNVRCLPVVTKSTLMANFQDWVTDPAVQLDELRQFVADPQKIGQPYLDRYVVCTTSGTTGVPAILLQDQATMNLMGALNILRSVPSWLSMKDLGRIIKAGMRTAAVWAAGGHYLGITMMKRQILEKPSRARAMRVFPVLDPLPKIVAGLNEFQPAMLNGYASAIALLAQEQEAGRLNIHPVLTMTSSETLGTEERERVARIFDGKVRDNYGCSEFVSAAYGCAEGWLHVHSDWVILEPVDANYQPVRPGESSKTVLLTNLANHVQPILRYNLGDRITLRPDPCPCGSLFPAIRVEGRTDEILRFRANDGSLVPILPLALWSVLKETPGLRRFQAIQTGETRLTIRLETEEEDRQAGWERVRGRLEGFLIHQNLPGIDLELSTELPVRDPRSGKYRHVWSEVRDQAAAAIPVLAS
jgi:phenylacetate-coenzyme A ligase PaaK-like adenylate-forming protein